MWLFLAFAIAFAVKSPIWPFHTWSPITYAEAPTAGSIELSALLAKLGSYGLLRFAVGLFPLAVPTLRPLILTLAVIGILYGSLVACATPRPQTIGGVLLARANGLRHPGHHHGLEDRDGRRRALDVQPRSHHHWFFLLIGFIEQRRGSYQIKDLTGLQGPAPVMAALFTVVMLASIGLPGLSGFVSEYLILIGTFGTHAWWGAAATLGVVAAAAYLLWAYQRVFHGKAEGANAETRDATTKERWVLVPVVALILVLGVFPKPVLDRITPSVQQPDSPRRPCGRQQVTIAAKIAIPSIHYLALLPILIFFGASLGLLLLSALVKGKVTIRLATGITVAASIAVIVCSVFQWGVHRESRRDDDGGGCDRPRRVRGRGQHRHC